MVVGRIKLLLFLPATYFLYICIRLYTLCKHNQTPKSNYEKTFCDVYNGSLCTRGMREGGRV